MQEILIKTLNSTKKASDIEETNRYYENERQREQKRERERK